MRNHLASVSVRALVGVGVLTLAATFWFVRTSATSQPVTYNATERAVSATYIVGKDVRSARGGGANPPRNLKPLP